MHSRRFFPFCYTVLGIRCLNLVFDVYKIKTLLFHVLLYYLFTGIDIKLALNLQLVSAFKELF